MHKASNKQTAYLLLFLQPPPLGTLLPSLLSSRCGDDWGEDKVGEGKPLLDPLD